ncbi:hypothetical protein BKA66DRAFT_191453 [Pyrenochaeta sp. MPI-SDFR-AT-0127]|nr:hypothetical protein BKA66DRAFT_191453 [Pyrenochaeta sp. MPI-SDFR-AT-0127]
MAVTYTVLYPRGSVFDPDYYANKHMPMAKKLLPTEVLSYEVYSFGDDDLYTIQCDIEFASDEAYHGWKDTEGGKKLLEDLKNFSTEEPVIMRRNHMVSSS